MLRKEHRVLLRSTELMGSGIDDVESILHFHGTLRLRVYVDGSVATCLVGSMEMRDLESST